MVTIICNPSYNDWFATGSTFLIRLMHLILHFLHHPSASPNFLASLPPPSLSTSARRREEVEDSSGVGVGNRFSSPPGQVQLAQLFLHPVQLPPGEERTPLELEEEWATVSPFLLLGKCN